MTSRIQENQLKAVALMILFIVLMLQSFITSAQRNVSQSSYRGFVANFGTRLGSLSSNISKIDQQALMLSGGQVGLTFGNDIMRSKIGLLGYYSSTGKTAGTIDLYQSSASVNFYPASLLMKRKMAVEPYFTGGIHYDQYKFYGYYINREPGTTNYSQSEAPYLGKVKQVNATAGIGVEVKLKDEFDFIHLFSEVTFGRNLSSNATNGSFENTHITNQTHITVGVSFGANR